MKNSKWIRYFLIGILGFVQITKIVADSITENITLSAVSDSLVLVTIYNVTNGENWSNKWDLEQPMSTWYGITTDVTGCVSEIDLSNNNLAGIIPVEIGDLSNLQRLSMSDNELTDTIPKELGQLNNLINTYLGGNQLTGNLPPEIGSLPNLLYFGINSNLLSGTIPPEFGNLTQLKGLYLASNEFTGSLPVEIGNLVNLKVLRLGYNMLSGPIPEEIGNLVLLDSLYGQNNQFSGTIPATMGNMTNLKVCYLNDNELSGALPTEIGNLAQLIKLGLKNNQFEGNIPASIGNTNLERLELGNNFLTGEIPPEIWTLTNLTVLGLNNNQFTGAISSEVGNLINLEFLRLNNNALSDTLPSQLANLSNLTEIHLNDNQLEGCFPAVFTVFCDMVVDYNFENNLLINDGNFNDFCVSNIGNCDNVSDIWAGDANHDGIVDVKDVFCLGLKNGQEGLARNDQSIAWTPNPSIDWANNLPDGRDAKYADCDGNGEINIYEDMIAVNSNYDSTHTEGLPSPSVYPTANILSLTSNAIHYWGDDIYLDYSVEFNDISDSGMEVYGFAFDLNYDNFATFGTLNISNSALGNPSEIYDFTYELNNNSTQVVMVKTNGANTIDLGTLADFIIVEDNIPSAGEGIPLGVSNVLITDNVGNMFGAAGQTVDLFITNNFTPGVDEENLLAMTIEATRSDCNGGMAEVIPFGAVPPYNYLWENGQTEAIATNLMLGNQFVTITDSSGKDVIGKTVIEGVELIQTTVATTDEGDGTGSIEITDVSGGNGSLSIVWENGLTGNIIDNIPAGEYTVTITDERGCVYTETIELLLNSTSTNNQLLNGKAIFCNLFPNPTTDFLNISLTNLPANEEFQLIIYNELGQKISEEKIQNTNSLAQINTKKDIRKLSAGNYLIHLNRADEILLTTVFVKQ